jgi:hypothetical protein
LGARPITCFPWTFTAFSTNGAWFGKNIKLSGKLSNPLNEGFGGAFPGDYNGNSWAGANMLYVT